MATTLLDRWLTWWDPMRFGFSLAHLASGTGCMFGVGGWCNPQGSMELRRGLTAAAADLVVGSARAGSASIVPWSWMSQASSTQYYFRLVARGPGGVAHVDRPGSPALARVTTSAGGSALPIVPAAPRGLSVVPRAGGRFALSWSYQHGAAFARPARFAIYTDAGSGTMYWSAPVLLMPARVALSGTGQYVLTTDPAEHGSTVQWAVRARSSAGDEEGNTVVVSATADAAGPPAAAVAWAEYGGDE